MPHMKLTPPRAVRAHIPRNLLQAARPEPLTPSLALPPRLQRSQTPLAPLLLNRPGSNSPKLLSPPLPHYPGSAPPQTLSLPCFTGPSFTPPTPHLPARRHKAPPLLEDLGGSYLNPPCVARPALSWGLLPPLPPLAPPSPAAAAASCATPHITQPMPASSIHATSRRSHTTVAPPHPHLLPLLCAPRHRVLRVRPRRCSSSSSSS